MVEKMANVLEIKGDELSAFRQASALDHVPEKSWLGSYVDDRAAAERRAVFMAFALLDRFAPSIAESMKQDWTSWPESPEKAAEMLEARLRTPARRRRP